MLEQIKHFGLKYGLTFFDETYHNQKVDIVREFQYSKKRMFSEEFYTLFIDLKETEEVIFSRFEKNTKYEINRAKQKDNITTVTMDARSDKYTFYDFYNKFAVSKHLQAIDMEETDLLIDNNMFIIRAAASNNEYMVLHSYVTANGRARLMQSASLFRESCDVSYRNMTGRANRLLHWEDIRYFKSQGYLIYDFGGISTDVNDKEKQAIARFKECFNGVKVKEYKSVVPITLKGLACILYKKIVGKQL
jgi:lipid II:glycine glycyltransferase (peptidoglycan interpeptide bridge formation enzyme)